MAKIVPYEVEKLSPVKVMEHNVVVEEIKTQEGKGTGKFSFKHEKIERTYDEPFMVYFHHGHSVRFLTREAMNAAGVFENGVGYVDDETGEPVEGERPRRSLKEKSLAKTIDRTLVGG